ncbi:MAG TPA: epoxyqueuosine reductase [Papillibacter sp.]|jgi:epoxyqueuosine reductase QueG|nr:epoxyqueuosine reductase [Papillibacter sp.]
MTDEAKQTLNRLWTQRVQEGGADFVYFVDVSQFPEDVTDGCGFALLFGKALSKEYVRALQEGVQPQKREFHSLERKMGALARKIAAELEAAGYHSIAKLKSGRLPHKTVALRAGLGFIGKNNLLVSPEYGCALVLGKVLTNAPFVTESHPPMAPQCGDCTVCVESCPTGALRGTTWNLSLTRKDMLTRKLCTPCEKCLVLCPYTVKYSTQSTSEDT